MIQKKEHWHSFKKELAELFTSSYGRSINPNTLDWRYFDNLSDNFYFSTEQREKVLVASYSAAPVKLYCNGKSYDTAMSMTTMTHPNARGQGLFPTLAKELYNELEKQNVGLIWGFPNVNSHSTFVNKLSWENIYEIPTLELKLETSLLSKMSSSPLVERDDEFSMDYSVSPLEESLLRVKKTKEYLHWRYKKNPANTYYNFVLSKDSLVSSYIVVKKYGEGVDLVDIQVRNEREALVLLSHIIREHGEQGYTRFQCWASVYHFVHSVLEKLNFQNVGPISYFGGKQLIHSQVPEYWNSFKSWYIQMGDSDVY